MRKFLFYLPMWMFFIVLAIIFTMALSACTTAKATPMPTFTPEEQKYRACLVRETRLYPNDNDLLDRAVIKCREEVK